MTGSSRPRGGPGVRTPEQRQERELQGGGDPLDEAFEKQHDPLDAGRAISRSRILSLSLSLSLRLSLSLSVSLSICLTLTVEHISRSSSTQDQHLYVSPDQRQRSIINAVSINSNPNNNLPKPKPKSSPSPSPTPNPNLALTQPAGCSIRGRIPFGGGQHSLRGAHGTHTSPCRGGPSDRADPAGVLAGYSLPATPTHAPAGPCTRRRATRAGELTGRGC